MDTGSERVSSVKVELRHSSSESAQTIALERMADDACAFEAIIDDRLIPVDIESNDSGGGRMRIGGRVHRYHVLRRDNTLHVWVDGRTYQFERIQATARRAGAAGSAKSANQLAAPMPGTILKINGNAGDAFDAHAPIIVMESMKMEMSLSAPTNVVLTSVDCQVGQLVEMGLVLARLEPVADAE